MVLSNSPIIAVWVFALNGSLEEIILIPDLHLTNTLEV